MSGLVADDTGDITHEPPAGSENSDSSHTEAVGWGTEEGGGGEGGGGGALANAQH